MRISAEFICIVCGSSFLCLPSFCISLLNFLVSLVPFFVLHYRVSCNFLPLRPVGFKSALCQMPQFPRGSSHLSVVKFPLASSRFPFGYSLTPLNTLLKKTVMPSFSDGYPWNISPIKLLCHLSETRKIGFICFYFYNLDFKLISH